jgi:hypothetical protein
MTRQLVIIDGQNLDLMTMNEAQPHNSSNRYTTSLKKIRCKPKKQPH